MLEASAKELLETVERTKDVHTALLQLQGVSLDGCARWKNALRQRAPPMLDAVGAVCLHAARSDRLLCVHASHERI